MYELFSKRASGLGSRVERLGLCLEFANTLHWHASDRRHETLHNCEEFLAWTTDQGIVSLDGFAVRLRRAWREVQAAAAVYRRAIPLAAAIYRIFVACIAQKAPARNDAQVLNGELRRALARYRIEFGSDGPTWGRTAEGELDSALCSIVQSASEVLLSQDLRERVGQCADPAGCSWLFLDLSKNRSRRWCSMKGCGNRAKQRRRQGRRR